MNNVETTHLGRRQFLTGSGALIGASVTKPFARALVTRPASASEVPYIRSLVFGPDKIATLIYQPSSLDTYMAIGSFDPDGRLALNQVPPPVTQYNLAANFPNPELMTYWRENAEISFDIWKTRIRVDNPNHIRMFNSVFTADGEYVVTKNPYGSEPNQFSGINTAKPVVEGFVNTTPEYLGCLVTAPVKQVDGTYRGYGNPESPEGRVGYHNPQTNEYLEFSLNPETKQYKITSRFLQQPNRSQHPARVLGQLVDGTYLLASAEEHPFGNMIFLRDAVFCVNDPTTGVAQKVLRFPPSLGNLSVLDVAQNPARGEFFCLTKEDTTTHIRLVGNGLVPEDSWPAGETVRSIGITSARGENFLGAYSYSSHVLTRRITDGITDYDTWKAPYLNLPTYRTFLSLLFR